MVPVERDNNWYGDDQADIPGELRRHSQLNGYLAEHFGDAVCACGGRTFRPSLGDTAGAAV